MDNRYKITKNDKPSLEQLISWYKNGDEIEFIEEEKGSFPHKHVHKGKIKILQPMGADALIWVENASFGFYLRNVISYKYDGIEPIFLETNSDLLDKIFLKAEDKIFCINKKLICERIDYFRAMFSSGMNESRANTIDLSNLLTGEELNALLLAISEGNCKTFNLKQAQYLLNAADKISDLKLVAAANVRITECIDIFNKEFLDAVKYKNYEKLSEYLQDGANIDINFGKFASAERDGSIYDCPNDTPLTYAVRTEDLQLTRFLLKNKANTEVKYMANTPLMNACFRHNVEMVSLLLQHGANPNNCESFAMHEVFLGMRDWLLDEQEEKAVKVVKLLLDHGYEGKAEDIAIIIKKRGYSNQIISLLYRIWNEQKYTIHSMWSKESRTSIRINMTSSLQQYLAENTWSMPVKDAPELFLPEIRGGKITSINDFEVALDELNTVLAEQSDEAKSLLRKILAHAIVNRFDLDYLKLAYRHPIFQHRNNLEFKNFINKSSAAVSGIFSEKFTDYNLIESNGQKILREGIETKSNNSVVFKKDK